MQNPTGFRQWMSEEGDQKGHLRFNINDKGILKLR
jgi:hypothetical protein